MSKRKDSQISKVERKIKKYKKMVDNLGKEDMCDEMEKEESAIDLANFVQDKENIPQDFAVEEDEEKSNDLSSSDLESLAQDEKDGDDSSPKEGTQSEINTSEPTGSAIVAVVAEDPQLDENFLRSLGQEGRDEGKEVRIHSQVAAIWTKILSMGLKKETKTDLLEKYPRKGNMRLEAPILNPEVEAVINDTAKKRDRFLGLDQSLCGATMSVLGSLVSEIILSKDNMKWMDIVQRLNDAGRLQCELMHQLSKARRVFIYPGFKKEARNLLERTKPDEFLFGDSLGDRLKTAKSAEKAGLSMKVAAPTRKSLFYPSTSENWRGPSARQYYQQTGHKIRIQGYQGRSKIYQNKSQRGRTQGLVRQQSTQVRPSQ